MRFTTKVLALAILCGGFASNVALAQEAALTKGDVEGIIKEYLLANPEVIFESIENYRAREELAQAQKAEEGIKKHTDYLTSAEAPSVGNPNADVVIVEFFDYNCGYCKKALPDIEQTLAQDPNVRFVFKDMPILSDTSRQMAHWALAAHKQGKFFEYHVELMNSRGSKSAADFKKIGEELGLDVAQLEADANSAAVEETINESFSVAQELGIGGTPAFIVNGKMYPGYIGPEGMKAAIAEARAQQ